MPTVEMREEGPGQAQCQDIRGLSRGEERSEDSWEMWEMSDDDRSSCPVSCHCVVLSQSSPRITSPLVSWLPTSLESQTSDSNILQNMRDFLLSVSFY